MPWELAQLNIAELTAPIDSPALADFVAELDRINALADQSPGFVWRLQSDDGNATCSEHGFGDDILANLSVWKSVDDLHHYIFRTAHAQFMSRRKEWFHRMSDAYSVLWWIAEGHTPTHDEAQRKLESLRIKGPTPSAFSFKICFPKPFGADHRDTREPGNS